MSLHFLCNLEPKRHRQVILFRFQIAYNYSVKETPIYWVYSFITSNCHLLMMRALVINKSVHFVYDWLVTGKMPVGGAQEYKEYKALCIGNCFLD